MRRKAVIALLIAAIIGTIAPALARDQRQEFRRYQSDDIFRDNNFGYGDRFGRNRGFRDDRGSSWDRRYRSYDGGTYRGYRDDYRRTVPRGYQQRQPPASINPYPWDYR